MDVVMSSGIIIHFHPAIPVTREALSRMSQFELFGPEEAVSFIGDDSQITSKPLVSDGNDGMFEREQGIYA